jgi:hypothetical protein
MILFPIIINWLWLRIVRAPSPSLSVDLIEDNNGTYIAVQRDSIEGDRR